MDRAQVCSQLHGPWEGGGEGGPGREKLWDGVQAGPSPCCPGCEPASPAHPPARPSAPRKGPAPGPVDGRPDQTSRTFSERVSEPHRQRAGERDLGCSGGRQFCSFFYAFEIKEMSRSFQNRGRKPGGTDCRAVNEVACSLQEGYRLVQRRVKPEAQQQRALA